MKICANEFCDATGGAVSSVDRGRTSNSTINSSGVVQAKILNRMSSLYAGTATPLRIALRGQFMVRDQHLRIAIRTSRFDTQCLQPVSRPFLKTVHDFTDALAGYFGYGR
jgi:hypothetical protein